MVRLADPFDPFTEARKWRRRFFALLGAVLVAAGAMAVLWMR